MARCDRAHFITDEAEFNLALVVDFVDAELHELESPIEVTDLFDDRVESAFFYEGVVKNRTVYLWLVQIRRVEREFLWCFEFDGGTSQCRASIPHILDDPSILERIGL